MRNGINDVCKTDGMNKKNKRIPPHKAVYTGVASFVKLEISTFDRAMSLAITS